MYEIEADKKADRDLFQKDGRRRDQHISKAQKRRAQSCQDKADYKRRRKNGFR